MTDREVTVRVGNSTSRATVIGKRGVPQGSALGPLLYNISEYDIPIEEYGDSGAIFADDNNIWALGTTLKEVEDILRSSLVQLEQWAGNLDLSCLRKQD